ncbi:MAG: hypothetical protein NVSMB63_11860 [Sediminibacterium sp.]
MKHILFLIAMATLTFCSCKSRKIAPSQVTEQGIAGYVQEISGNRMPMKDAPPVVPQPVQTTVFVYEPTNITQVAQIGTSPLYTAISTKMVASVESDSTGAFMVALPAGNYSLFVRRGNAYYANLFDTGNNISLFTVEEGKLTKVKIIIDSAASY